MKTISVTLTVFVLWCVSVSAGQISSSEASSQVKTPAKVDEAKMRMPASVPAMPSQAAVDADEDEIDLNTLVEMSQRDDLASIERDLDF